MSDKRIIYKKDDGVVSIIVPVTKSGLTVEQIAKKDVPYPPAYKKRSRPEIMGRFMLKKKSGEWGGRFDTVHTTYTRPKGKKGRTA